MKLKDRTDRSPGIQRTDKEPSLFILVYNCKRNFAMLLREAYFDICLKNINILVFPRRTNEDAAEFAFCDVF